MSLRDHLPTPFAPILMNVPTKNPCTGPFELCQEEIGSFRCECKVNGFGRASTDSNCTDIVECSENQNPCTGPFEFCQTDSGSFMCDCTTKVFERPSADSHCTENDECCEKQNPCTEPFELC